MYSFDVFDTLITRKTATPKGIFALMQDKLVKDEQYIGISDYVRNNFFELRINSEALAGFYCSNTHCAVTLERIYYALAMTGKLSDADVKALTELEKQTEYENVVGINENISKVKELASKGEHIVLISDMYLDSGTIRKMLLKADNIFKDIPLYVSCEYNAAKDNGKLYHIIKNKENLNNKDWFHFGDNFISDVQAAKNHGIKPELYKYQCLLPCEQAVLQSNENNSFIQLAVGAARNARLNHKLDGTAAIGTSVGGGLLFSYAWWIVCQCRQNGINRLYFIARDGYVLKITADIIIKKLGYNIETHYIYGSRRAWRMPSFTNSSINIIDIIKASDPGTINSIKQLSELLKISESGIAKFVPEGYKGKFLSPNVLYDLAVELQNNNEFKSYVIDCHKQERQMAVDYLKQEIDTSDNAFAFVELYGSGYTQICMANLMSDFCPFTIKTFYFALDRIGNIDNCVFYSFIPCYFKLNYLLETFCRSPHSLTVGYCKQNDRIMPVFEGEEGKLLINYGLNDYISGIEKFADEFAGYIYNNSEIAPSVSLSLKYLHYIANTPDKQLQDYIGNMPFNNRLEKQPIKFAPMLSAKDICNIYLIRTNEPIKMFYNGCCFEYSLLRCRKKDNALIEFCKRHNTKLLGKTARFVYKLLNNCGYLYNEYNFPVELLQKRIVLYGAGKAGQKIHKTIKDYKKCKIASWVDANYKMCRKKGLRVSPVESIVKLTYDQIVIAVLDKFTAEQIKASLVSMGVPTEKIFWFDLNNKWQ